MPPVLLRLARGRLVGKGDPFIKTVIDQRWQIVSKIADGGMGSVYRARDLRRKRDVAVKILPPSLSRDTKLIRRFKNEAAVMASLDHPNIIRVLGSGRTYDTFYIAMELLPGRDLAKIIAERAPLSVRQTFQIAVRVAEGLAYAHKKGILHRDIKPSNIIVDSKGRAVITDFGIAKMIGGSGLTTTGTALGTPEYMSVEQVKGERLDKRTDVYSLGLVVYEMLTGRSPFRMGSSVASISKILSEPAPPVGRIRRRLPGWAADIVNKAVARNRADRYKSAEEFLRDVRAGLRKGPSVMRALKKIFGKTKKTTVPRKIPKKEKRVTGFAAWLKKVFRACCLLVILTIVGLIAWMFWVMRDGRNEEPGEKRTPHAPVVLTPEAVMPLPPGGYVPVYRGAPAGTGVYEGTVPGDLPALLWKSDPVGAPFSTPAVSGGRVYAGGGDGYLYCMDAATGTVWWRSRAGSPVYSSPAVADGIVCFGSFGGKLVSAEAETGAEIWRYAAGGEIGSSPVIVDGMVYCGSYDGAVFSLDAATGKEKWRGSVEGSVHGTVAVAEGIVYVASGGGILSALDAATGRERWRLSGEGAITSSPAVRLDRVYFGRWDRFVYAASVRDGAILWRFETGGQVLSSPAVTGETVFVGSDDGGLYALSTADGTLIWRFVSGGAVVSSPVVVGNAVLFGSDDGNLYVLDAKSGRELWRYTAGSPVRASPCVVNGVVYFCDGSGGIYALK
jgi:outer membrane protein assembly factor BamB/predicted Ser/Thr protein kinase